MFFDSVNQSSLSHSNVLFLALCTSGDIDHPFGFASEFFLKNDLLTSFGRDDFFSSVH